MKIKKMSKSFLYFAYGSNLLAKRIHMNSPSAVRKGCGKLKDYRLDFNLYSKRWRGASATVVPAKDEIVWGAIWEIDLGELANLDRQEGVHQNIYFPIEAEIETSEGDFLKCRLYQQVTTPSFEPILPDERQPSFTYLNTIITGAAESNLPEYYQAFLKGIPHNNYRGEGQLNLLLDE